MNIDHSINLYIDRSVGDKTVIGDNFGVYSDIVGKVGNCV